MTKAESAARAKSQLVPAKYQIGDLVAVRSGKVVGRVSAVKQSGSGFSYSIQGVDGDFQAPKLALLEKGEYSTRLLDFERGKGEISPEDEKDDADERPESESDVEMGRRTGQ